MKNDKNNLTKTYVEFLYNGLKEFYPAYFFSPEVAEEIPPAIGYEGYTRDGFRNLVLRETKAPTIPEAIRTLVTWKETEPALTVPLDLEEKLEKLDEGKKEKEIKEQKEEKLQPKKTRLRKSYGEAKEEQEEVFIEPIQKPEPIILTPEEKQALDELIEKAENNPSQLTYEITANVLAKTPAEIKSSIPRNQLEIAAQVVAVEAVKRLREIGNEIKEGKAPTAPENTASILASLAGSKDQELAKASQESALLSEAYINAKKALTYPVVGPRIGQALWGSDQAVSYKESQEETPGSTHRINIGQYLDSYKKFRDASKQIFAGFESGKPGQVFSFIKDSFNNYKRNLEWKIPTRSFIGDLWAVAFPKKVIPAAIQTSSYVPQESAYNLLAKRGIPLLISVQTARLIRAPSGLAFRVALTALGKDVVLKGAIRATATRLTMGVGIKVGAKALTTLVVKEGVKKGITAVVTALGSIVPIVGNIIGLIIGWIGGEIIVKLGSMLITWIQKHKEDFFLILAAGMIGAGIVIGGLFGGGLVVLGTLGGLGALAAKAGGIGVAGNGIAGFGNSIMYGITSVALPAIGVPAIIALVATPAIIAIILFIINSGAFLVPPSLGVGESLGPGGAYPSCWPTTGRITQGPAGNAQCGEPNCTHDQFNTPALDIAGALGESVYATHDGTASALRHDLYGNYVLIVSPLGFSTIYAHLSEITFSGSTQVTAGTLIGRQGATGHATGVHLHYEIRGGGIDFPPYVVGQPVSGCFANEQGGSQIPPGQEITPGPTDHPLVTSCKAFKGKWFPDPLDCPRSGCGLALNYPKYPDIKGKCCDVTSPQCKPEPTTPPNRR